MASKQRILNPQPLILSYSYSGNTHRIAKGIQELTKGDRCEIYPWQPYPMAFPELLRQVKEEVEHGYHPALLPGAPSPASYRVIFVGSPNWCGTIAPPLASWLYKNDLSGKLLLPFYSHCGGVKADFRKDISVSCLRMATPAAIAKCAEKNSERGRTMPRSSCGALFRILQTA